MRLINNILNEVGEKINSNKTVDEVHRRRVSTYLDIPNRNNIALIESKLAAHNLVWSIDRRFIERFKYHACLDEGVYDGFFITERVIRGIRYCGDLPDTVMDKIDLAKVCGLSFFTIHSMEPMPVKYFGKTDPVMVGWAENPNIIMYSGKIRDMKERTGIVIATWDMDKELEIL